MVIPSITSICEPGRYGHTQVYAGSMGRGSEASEKFASGLSMAFFGDFSRVPRRRIRTDFMGWLVMDNESSPRIQRDLLWLATKSSNVLGGAQQLYRGRL